MEYTTVFDLKFSSKKFSDFLKYIPAINIVLFLFFINKLIILIHGVPSELLAHCVQNCQYIQRNRKYCQTYTQFIYELIRPRDVYVCAAQLYDGTNCTLLSNFRLCDEHHKALKLHCAAYHITNNYKMIPEFPRAAADFSQNQKYLYNRVNIFAAIAKGLIPRGLYRFIARMAIVEDRLRDEHARIFRLTTDIAHRCWQNGLKSFYKKYYEIDDQDRIVAVKRERRWESAKRLKQIKNNNIILSRYADESDSGEETDEGGCGDISYYSNSDKIIENWYRASPGGFFKNAVAFLTIELDRLYLPMEYKPWSDSSSDSGDSSDGIFEESPPPVNWIQRIREKEREFITPERIPYSTPSPPSSLWSTEDDY